MLIDLFDQIDKQVGHYLFITRSPYMNIYKHIIETLVSGKDMFNNVVIIKYSTLVIFNWLLFSAKRETNLINKFLETLTKHINAIESNGIVDAKLELSMLMRKLALIWVNCPNFQNYEYIITLIKVIGNMIMVEVR